MQVVTCTCRLKLAQGTYTDDLRRFSVILLARGGVEQTALDVPFYEGFPSFSTSAETERELCSLATKR